MGSGKKNLLEAFRNAGEVPLPQDEKHEEALRPLTADEERLLAEETRLQADLTRGGRHSWKSELPPMPAWLLYVAGAGLLFVVAVAVFGGGDGVAASDGDTPAAGGSGEAGREAGSARPQADPAPRTEAFVPATPRPEQAAPPAQATSPLTDRANAWTVVVVTYSRSASGAEDLAWATHDHLLAQGIPVHPLVEVGKNIVVLAGAAPRSSDLEELIERIGSLERDGRAHIYSGAYAERIDKFLDRY